MYICFSLDQTAPMAAQKLPQKTKKYSQNKTSKRKNKSDMTLYS